MNSDSYFICHHGIKGQKWGIRRFQNLDGTLTPAGKRRYLSEVRNEIKDTVRSVKDTNKELKEEYKTRRRNIPGRSIFSIGEKNKALKAELREKREKAIDNAEKRIEKLVSTSQHLTPKERDYYREKGYWALAELYSTNSKVSNNERRTERKNRRRKIANIRLFGAAGALLPPYKS